MQENAIEIDGSPKFGDFLRAYFWQQLKAVWSFYLMSLFASAGILFLSARSKSTIDISFVIPLIMIFVLLGSVFLAAVLAGKKFNGNVHYTFSESGVEIKTSTSTNTRSWSQFNSARETSQYFLLLVSKLVATPIPKRFFQNINQVQEFRKLVHKKLGDKATLRND